MIAPIYSVKLIILRPRYYYYVGTYHSVNVAITTSQYMTFIDQVLRTVMVGDGNYSDLWLVTSLQLLTSFSREEKQTRFLICMT